jgi:hypothetical protein
LARNNRSDTRSRTEAEREQARLERERRRREKEGLPAAPPLPPPAGVEPAPPVEQAAAPPVEQAAEQVPARPAEQVSMSPPEQVPVPPVEQVPARPVEQVSAPPAEQVSMSPAEQVPAPPVEQVAAPPVERVAAAPVERVAAPSDPRGGLGPLPPRRRPGLHKPHLSRPHGPHLHHSRTHERAARRRSGPARAGAVFAIVVVLAVLAGAAVLLLHHHHKPKPPPPAPAIVKVTIPEGYTRTQIAELAKADGLRGSYLAASKSSRALDLAHYRAPAHTSTLEGFLFPATYELYAGAPAGQLVSDQLTAFGENFGGGEVHRAKVLGVTPYELLTVASIIEREVELPHDRPLVAAVVYNRLRLHMTLGIDSTLRYALHDFTHPLTETELHSDSPYNTRVHKGLPPTPISNPGAAAIEAAGRPAHVSYLYYVSGADGCGEQVFSTEYSKFEKDAAAYNEAIRRNGGRVPRCKKK